MKLQIRICQIAIILIGMEAIAIYVQGCKLQDSLSSLKKQVDSMHSNMTVTVTVNPELGKIKPVHMQASLPGWYNTPNVNLHPWKGN